MHLLSKHNQPKVKVAARANTAPLLSVVVLILVSISVLLVGRTVSGY